jgi:D-3-phosphoglycerate dehydrogenase
LNANTHCKPVNEILGNHNVDKQITDNKGDVKTQPLFTLEAISNKTQVAYLMADISNVQTSDIKEISDSLEALSCKSFQYIKNLHTD